MLDNIPAELREYNSWLVWRYEDKGSRKPTKIPYDPKTGKLANVNEPSTWSSFIVACTAYHTGNYDGIGFIFSNNDPYTFIDLDDPAELSNGETNPHYQLDLDRQIKIFKEFDSYSEVSPSGKGLHIIIKGSVPNGRRRSFVEIYSSQRYATMTGNVHSNKPIVEQQEKLSQLWAQMGAGGIATKLFEGEKSERFNDQEIVEQAKVAVNGSKFIELYDGNWQNLYPSQSEADFAFVDIVAFYTQNKQQISRIFKRSRLGQRDKAKRSDYIDRMINRSFDRMLPSLDFDGFKNALEDKLKAVPKSSFIDQQQMSLAVETQQTVESSVPIPPGLIGEIAHFIYQAAPRPVPEIALAGAIGLMAGICGRAYNVSNTGLNQYILLLAKTGMGKEGMAQGIDKLMNAIRLQVPTSSNFIGPSHLPSGQGLKKYIHRKSQCFVSIIGEFGLALQNISNPRASSHEFELQRTLLELYHKSGANDAYRGSAYSDLEKNTEATMSPAFTLLGETVPQTFYSILNEDMITTGLLPRFLLIEYNGNRPKYNKNHSNILPPFQLIEKLSSLVANVEMIMHAKRVITIKFTQEAEKMSDDFDNYADNMMNRSNDEVILHLWNRAHLKAMKFAGLIAVGCNMSDPQIEVSCIQLAINMVQKDIKDLLNKFEKGEIGSNTQEMKQDAELIRFIKEYINGDLAHVSKYVNTYKMHDKKVIPYAYLSRRTAANACYKADRLGATAALKRAIQVLIDSDKIRELNKRDLIIEFGTTQRAFLVSNTKILEN